jgi:hypothetical protein
VLIESITARGIAKAWALSSSPMSELRAECRRIAESEEWLQDGSGYLALYPIIRESVESVLAQLAMAAGVRWQSTSPVLQPLARRGWHIGRWLPTFLLIDGPLGRLLRDRNSPINTCLRRAPADFPLLASARDAFNSDLFRKVRNGFGHWSFQWRDEPGVSWITIVHWETGTVEASLSLLEAEGLHILTFAVIEAIDKEILVETA